MCGGMLFILYPILLFHAACLPRRGTGDSVLEVLPGAVLDLPGILDTTSIVLLQVLYGEGFATTPGEQFKLKIIK